MNVTHFDRVVAFSAFAEELPPVEKVARFDTENGVGVVVKLDRNVQETPGMLASVAEASGFEPPDEPRTDGGPHRRGTGTGLSVLYFRPA